MASDGKIKLFKIASEINIGKDAIVEFLQSKGYDIENKPTSNLTEEMVDVVLEKFKREKKAAEKQREKLQKHKDIRRPAEVKPRKADELPFAEAKPSAEDDTHRIQAEAKQQEPIHDAVADSAQHEVQSESQQAHVVDTPTVVIHIEQKPVVEAPAEVIEKIDVIHVEHVETAAIRTDQSVSEEIKVPATVVPVAEPHDVAAEPIPKEKEIDENIREPKEDKIDVKDITETAPPSAEPIDTEDEVVTGVAEEVDSSDKSQKSDRKRRRKRKRLLEVEVQPGEAPKLRGLTIVGKIDLEAERLRKESLKPLKKKEVDPDDELDEKGKAKKKKPKGKVKEKAPLKEKEDKRKKKKKRSIRDLITEEDVDRAIRETLAGMGETTAASQRSKMRQKKRIEREEKEMRISEQKERESHVLKLTEYVTTSDLANTMNINPNEVILKCMQLGLMVTINQRLNKDAITLIADDYGFDVEFLDERAEEFDEEIIVDEENLEPRPPIVTIMGHVDHGKTSLLDQIRHTNVVAGEAGGITQHIAAYSVALPNRGTITFLDTPGHEAFTAMRARGAQVTDIVVLVVAADDSVMPQTIEAISHARAANVPIVVAINKIDKADAKPERIKQQLTDHQILVEEWGGKNQSAEISAKAGLNIENLLEKILLEAEMLELKANPNRIANGIIIEAHMDKGLGTVATVIVQQGTLRIGDSFVAGVHYGRVRAMFDERGQKVDGAPPGTPVVVIGFDGVPEAGDKIRVYESDAEARAISSQRKALKREQELRQVKHISLDEISKQIQLGGVKELFLIIKGDVGGSVEAISDSLQKLSRDEARVIILHKGVGSINESDILLASASGAVTIGFNVSVTANAKKLAERESVDIRLYDIIYDCINEVQLALEGLLTPEIKEDVTSQVEVRRVFKISKIGAVAGCYVLSGKISRNDRIRVLRDGLPVFSGSISSLKRNKDDVKEADTGYECGIQLDGFNDIRTGDIIEGYKLIEVKKLLS